MQSAFALKGKIYAGMGINEYPSTATYQDFWQYDPGSNQWTQLQDFPGGPRSGARSFAIGNKGYQLDDADFWEYLPDTDEWVQKNTPQNLSRVADFLFVAAGKAYFRGTDDNAGVVLWEFNPVNDQWTERAAPPLSSHSINFSTGEAGYIGMGNSTAVWAYYPLIECE